MIQLWHLVFSSLQLQLEIALLQGELQTEQEQLHRHMQKLETLKTEARQQDKRKHSDRLKVCDTLNTLSKFLCI